MRKFTTFAALAASTLLLAGCSGGGVESESETIADTSSNTPTSGAPLADGGNQGQSGQKITDVPDSRFMPPGASAARVFRLADGVTECFANSLGPDSYLTCRTNFANPPMVQSYGGEQVPANAVTWAPGAAPVFAHMNFPDAGHQPATLNAYERVKMFGFTCTAYGPATVECGGPGGSASLDAGNVTGATVPAPTEAPTPPTEGLPVPSLPDIGVPDMGDIIGPKPGR